MDIIVSNIMLLVLNWMLLYLFFWFSMYKLLTESDVQLAYSSHLRKLREQAKLSRDALALRSTVPAATIKKFELTGQISFRQLLLLWQSLDDLTRLYQLTLEVRESSQAPKSIEEVLKHGI